MKTMLATLAVIGALVMLIVPAHAQHHERQLSWSGDVDDTVIISIHGNKVVDRAISGKDTQNVNVDFDGRLPHEPVKVEVTSWSGRGTVDVVRQPDPYNDYTAEVRVYDPQTGRGHYTFNLSWHPIDFGAPIPRN